LEAQLRAEPDDWQRHALLGLALAYLGRKPDAIREGQRGVALMPISRDAYFGLTVSYSWSGSTCTPASRTSRWTSSSRCSGCHTISHLAGWLRIDPTFDPLRKHPRFRKLVEGTA
jgi:hypothetical protein